MSNPNPTPAEIAEAIKEFGVERLHSHGVPVWVTVLGEGCKTLLAALEAEQHETKSAFDYLASLGVPKDRAITVSNGINVYETRMQREVQALTDRATRAEARCKELEKAGNAMREAIGYGQRIDSSKAWDALTNTNPE